MDLFQRHYVRSDEEAKADLQKWTEANEGRKAGVDLAAPVKTEQEQERTEESEEEEGEAKVRFYPSFPPLFSHPLASPRLTQLPRPCRMLRTLSPTSRCSAAGGFTA